ncbi:SHOCT domain-containing protein [Lentibacillus sediminis]|uniref:SHOCT domain-containing protein n=1 Tax=Lentibacillus sediminis TaxID=1940529 RepID=UPI000C1C7A37|nr:SHOCT domain-containing protein [Lentibacillus sediminis]
MGLREKWKENKRQIREAMEKREEELNNEPKYLAKQEREKKIHDILAKWSGDSDTSKLERQLYGNKNSILYADKEVLKEYESVLGFVGADYGDVQNKKIFGVLIITDDRLLFAQKDKKSSFKQSWKHNKINGIKDGVFPLKPHQLQIEVGKSKVIFHRIKKKDQFNTFIKVLQNKIDNPEVPKKSNKPTQNKYKLLEQIAKLKDDGTLTEDEFAAEKKKILEG